MLSLEHIDAGYAGTPVLRDVNIVVPPSSVVALLGANGAGKTTLLRVASGLLSPTAGRLTVAGKDVTAQAPHSLVRYGVCHVPEGRGVWPSLTVRENLLMQSIPGREREAEERAVEAFPRLGQRMGQLAGTMSGGEQQMLALARAYVQSPKYVLLDEVSMGLAPLVVDAIFEFLAKLAAEGASLLLVEQYISRALEIADYVYILKRGEVIFTGEPSELEGGAEVLEAYVGAA
jgi:branched-chain amino acid transport system ATP-binding protein